MGYAHFAPLDRQCFSVFGLCCSTHVRAGLRGDWVAGLRSSLGFIFRSEGRSCQLANRFATMPSDPVVGIADSRWMEWATSELNSTLLDLESLLKHQHARGLL